MTEPKTVICIRADFIAWPPRVSYSYGIVLTAGNACFNHDRDRIRRTTAYLQRFLDMATGDDGNPDVAACLLWNHQQPGAGRFRRGVIAKLMAEGKSEAEAEAWLADALRIGWGLR